MTDLFRSLWAVWLRFLALTLLIFAWGGLLDTGSAGSVSAQENAAVPNDSAANDSASAESSAASSAATGRFQKDKNSPAVTFKDAKGEEIPIVDAQGRVVFQRPEDKPIEEMTEADFYKTLSPAEKAILAKEPVTACDQLRAAVKISRLGRKRFAAIFVEKSFSAEGTPAEFAALIDEIGPDKLFQFGTDPALGERGAEALRRVFAEAQKHWESPDAIRDAFDRTLKGSEADRVQAILDLRKGGAAAFGILLEELYTDDPGRSNRAKEMLNRLGDYAKSGLMAELMTADAKKLLRLADVFAEMPNLPNLSPLLIRYYDASLSEEARQALGNAITAQAGAIPDKSEAATQTADYGRRFFERKIVLGPSQNGEQTFWRWNAETKTTESVTRSGSEIYRFQAAYLLLGAHKIDPAHAQITAEAAAALSERILYETGLDTPPDLDRFKSEFGDISANELTAALDVCVKSGHPKGGVILARLLGQTQDKSLVTGSDQVTALVRMATDSDRRLRFAALEAIDALNPETSFPGSANVINALLHFATASGKRVALIGVSKVENGSLIGSSFSDGTVRIIPVTSGGQLIRLAQENADVEYAIAVSYLKNPDPRTVCQTLGADYRTSDIPVFVGIENETYIEQGEHYALRESNALALPLPSDRETGAWALAELYKKVNPEQIPAERRLEQARLAVDMLTRRLGEHQTFCEPETLDTIAVDFLRRPEIRDPALRFALIAPSPKVQTALADAVTDRRIPLEERKKFLDAFGQHMEKYGRLLRGPDLRRLYDAYNATEPLPTAEQKIMSDLLDTIEKGK